MPFPGWWARSVYSLWHGVRYPRLRAALAEQRRADWLSRSELQQLQLDRLKALLSHAWRNCPFYRRRLTEAGLAEGRINSLADLSQLPLLTKRDIQQNRDDLVGRNFSRNQLRADYTGGSSGDPLHFYTDLKNFPQLASRRYRGDMLAGWDFGKRIAMLWGTQIDSVRGKRTCEKLYRWATNDMLIDCNKLNSARLDQYIRRIKYYRPHTIVAFTTLAALFAEKLLERNETGIRPENVVITAENETPVQRKMIENAFGCEVFNRYGCREMSIVACECDQHREKHIFSDQIILEIVDDDGNQLPPGQTGWIALTDLFNYGMPFIRYRIGDIGSLSEASCACGRGLPFLANFTGGDPKVIRLPSGWRAGPTLVTALCKKLRTAANYQLVCKGKTDFTLRVLKGPDFDESELPPAVTMLEKVLGPGVAISAEYVDSIIRGPGGKHDFLVICPPEEQSR